jgi:membrane protease YdiL (CAAX protease family)
MKYKMLAYLLLLPPGVSAFEAILKYVFTIEFGSDLPVERFGITCILILAFILLSKEKYGLIIPKEYKKLTLGLVLVLIATSMFFFFALSVKGLYASNSEHWNARWSQWLFIVFREEIVLRGFIQTKASEILKGKFLGLSNSIWFSCVIFAFWHLINLFYGFPLQAVLIQIAAVFIIGGPLLGWIREKTGSSVISYLVHQNGDFFFYSLYLLLFSKLLF